MAIFVCKRSPINSGITPVIFFTDLVAGPKTGGLNNAGCFITIYGKHFGPSGSVTMNNESCTVISWEQAASRAGLDKVVIQPTSTASTGNIVLTSGGLNSNGMAFTVQSGNIYFVDASSPNNPGSGTLANPWRSPASCFGSVTNGDIIYFRTGTYKGKYDDHAWGGSSLELNQDETGTAWIAYPSEIAAIQPSDYPNAGGANACFLTRAGGSQSNRANNVTISGLVLQGNAACIDGGGIIPPDVGLDEDDYKGSQNLRVVDCDCSAVYDYNTFTALLTMAGDNCKFLGNYCHDVTALPSFNNNHAVYMQNGADNLEVGWNKFTSLQMGHVIQLHGDYFFEYENFSIHDNLIIGDDVDDCRGIVIGGANGTTYGSIYNNILVNLGQGFSAILVLGSGGAVNIYNNTLIDVEGDGTDGAVRISNQNVGTQSATASTIVVKDNIFRTNSTPYIGAGFGATFSQITVDYNVYFGNGNGPTQDTHRINSDPLVVNEVSNWHLQSGSPAKAAGTNTGVTHDFDGYTRPQGVAYSIGAYE